MQRGTDGRHWRTGAALGLLLTACALADRAPAGPPLTTANAIRIFQHGGAASGERALHIQGIVTYFEEPRGILYLQDATGGIGVSVGTLETPVEVGEVVVLSGTLDARAPLRVQRPSLSVLGQSFQQIPDPRVVTVDEILSGAREAEWLEIHGIVRSETRANGRVVFTLESGGRAFTAETPDREDIRKWSLVDAHVRVRGVAAQKQPGRTADVLAPNAGYIRIEQDAPVPGAAAAPEPAAALTTVAAVRALSKGEAERGHPVRLRAVVTYTDDEAWLLFVQDDTAGIYVEAWRHLHHVRPGDLVEVSGVSAAGAFAPIIEQPRVRVLGRAPFPAARRVQAEDLKSGQLDSQWVEVEGIVRALAPAPRGTVLHLAAGGSRLVVQMAEPFDRSRLAPLVSARVRLRGVCRSLLTEKGQLADTTILSPELSALERLTPTPTDLFSLPSRPVGTLLQFVPGQSWEQPVRVSGVVTYARPGRLFVRDATGGLKIEVTAAELPEVGDEIDAVGFASPGDYSPVLQDAMFRVVRNGAPPSAEAITPDRALSGRLDGALVQVDAVFLESARNGDLDQLLLEAAPFRFTAALPRTPESSLRLRPGSGLRLTGIFVVNVGEQRLPQGFHLLLRGPADVEIRRAASWWTVERARWVALSLAAIVIIALVWVVTLRRQVAAQYRVIWNRVKRETELEERHRMARELHDTLEQNLTGTCLALEAADLTLTTEPKTAARHLGKAIVQVRESIKAVHRSVWALRDEGAGERDLATLLADMGKELSECSPTPIEVVTRHSGPPRAFSLAVENNLLRIGQEALTNAVRHGHATHIEIELTHEPERFRLVVRDDGRGFDPQAPVPAGHFGLLGMRERAASIGARLEVTSLANRGTEISVTLRSQAPALQQVV